MTEPLDLTERIRGCLVGGAIGDALGAPVEFDSWSEIRARFGPAGITIIEPPGEFTDDTQMTLFTCDGLIRCSGGGDRVAAVHHAYLRWLATQRGTAGEIRDGWLVADERLHRRRAPGTTCLSALMSGGIGTVDDPLNDSKGCGGVMRAAPAGLVHAGDPMAAFELGCHVAAITHGHPDGWQPAGALAAMVAMLTRGAEIANAARHTLRLVTGDTARLLGVALDLAHAGSPTPEAIERELGGGWVGDEALAISVWCAASAASTRAAMLAAVNHSGDTDSTGSMCGNLLGARHGVDEFPSEWRDGLDARDLVEAVAADLALALRDPPSPATRTLLWAERYPAM